MRIKASNLAEIFVLGFLIRKNMASCENQTQTLDGAKKGWGGVFIMMSLILYNVANISVKSIIANRVDYFSHVNVPDMCGNYNYMG